MRVAMTRSPSMMVRLAAAALLLALPVAASAQPAGSIDGTVVDANGSPLPGVVVTVTGPGVRAELVTGADGAYVAAGLAAGDYVVTAMLPGFETAEVPASVRAGATETVPIVLQITRLLETVSVIAEEPRIFARNVVAEPMILQQSNITSVTSVVDNLPGVSVQEGDAYGFDDWSSNVAVRGFQVTINEVQVGTTIDGFPNGTSDYWSGAKANRFIDPMNLGGHASPGPRPLGPLCRASSARSARPSCTAPGHQTRQGSTGHPIPLPGSRTAVLGHPQGRLDGP